MRQYRKPPLSRGLVPLVRAVLLSTCLLLAVSGCEDDPQRPSIGPQVEGPDLDGDGFTPPEDCLDEGFAWLPDRENCGEDEVFAFAPANGEGAKDFSAVLDDDVLHFFHIENPGPLVAGVHERSLGHASSVDLREWETHPSILPVQPGDHWMREAVWAPHVIQHQGRWYMFVTGVQVLGEVANNRQRIGLFVSDDLFTWAPVDRRCDGVGGDGCILDCAAAFTNWGSELPWSGDCRDAFVLPTDDGWVMYVTLRVADEGPALGIAKSENLLDWELVGWIRESRDLIAESPTAIVRDGEVQLFWTTPTGIQYLRSHDPYATHWSERTPLTEVRGFANEFLPAGLDTWFLFYVSGPAGDLRIFLERIIFEEGGLRMTRNVAPECRIPAREIHPLALDPVDGIDNDCDGHIDSTAPTPSGPTVPGLGDRGLSLHLPRGRF